MTMKNKTILSIFILLLMASVSLSADATAPAAEKQMKKLEPFVGKWKTRSVYPDKELEVHGHLEYRWVLGKTWLLNQFVGKHPEKDYWEAYAMIKYDAAKQCYVSHDFFNGNDPIIMTGTWITKNTIRFQYKDEKGKWGIDYTAKPDGSIYQENWVEGKKGTRKITLKTDYTRVPEK